MGSDHHCSGCPVTGNYRAKESAAAGFATPLSCFAADQLLTNSPSRSRARGNWSVIAAKPRRKCEGASKQSPGASRMPCSAAPWQKERLFSPLRSQGNAVIPPRGGIQPNVSRCSVMKASSCRRFCVAVSCVFPRTVSRWRIATSASISPAVLFEIEK